MVMLELELELKWKWQRRQKLWARAPFGYITMMALPLGTNNCFGFGFVFGFGFGFGFRLRLRRLFSVPVCFRVWFFLCEESFDGEFRSWLMRIACDGRQNATVLRFASKHLPFHRCRLWPPMSAAQSRPRRLDI